MLYAAKCYWPGVSQSDLEAVAKRAAQARFQQRPNGAAYLGSLLFSEDDLVLCLFQAPSRAAVKRASDAFGVPCERVMDSVWLQPQSTTTTNRPRPNGRVARRK